MAKLFAIQAENFENKPQSVKSHERTKSKGNREKTAK